MLHCFVSLQDEAVDFFLFRREFAVGRVGGGDVRGVLLHLHSHVRQHECVVRDDLAVFKIVQNGASSPTADHSWVCKCSLIVVLHTVRDKHC